MNVKQSACGPCFKCRSSFAKKREELLRPRHCDLPGRINSRFSTDMVSSGAVVPALVESQDLQFISYCEPKFVPQPQI